MDEEETDGFEGKSSRVFGEKGARQSAAGSWITHPAALGVILFEGLIYN